LLRRALEVRSWSLLKVVRRSQGSRKRASVRKMCGTAAHLVWSKSVLLEVCVLQREREMQKA